MNLIFWIKSFGSLFTGYNRSLKKYRDIKYDHKLDKHPVRNKHHGTGGWKEKKTGGLQYRDYDSYEEYITHQRQKFDEIVKMGGGFKTKDLFFYRIKFYKRFRILSKYLPKKSKILCAGARQGTEVEVLRDLGYNSAYGVDLNPGPNNELVEYGDFMKLNIPNESLDMVYSNSIDHAIDIEKFFKEHARVLKPNGYVLYDIAIQKGGAFEAVEWDSDETVFQIMKKYFKTVVEQKKEKNWKWLLLKKN